MATPLNKAVHRVVEIDGDKYLASLEPETEQYPASYALRKMRTSKCKRTPIATLAPEAVQAIQPTIRVPDATPSFTAADVKSMVAISPMDYKLKVEVLRAVDELLAVEELVKPEDNK